MTAEQVQKLNLGIAPIGVRETVIVGSAFDWIKQNTTLAIDIENEEELTALPDSVRLFIIKFFDLNMLNVGVSSESIEGLSQSYDSTDKNTLIWQFAEELLSPYLKSRVRFVAAERKWR